jgi:hypothetical protein
MQESSSPGRAAMESRESVKDVQTYFSKESDGKEERPKYKACIR